MSLIFNLFELAAIVLDPVFWPYMRVWLETASRAAHGDPLYRSVGESIGREKAGIMRTGKPVVVSDPLPPQSVLDRALEVGADLWRVGVDFNVSGDKQQWGWAGRGRRYSGLAYPALRGANQLVNAAGVLAALAEAIAQFDEQGGQLTARGLPCPGLGRRHVGRELDVGFQAVVEHPDRLLDGDAVHDAERAELELLRGGHQHVVRAGLVGVG